MNVLLWLCKICLDLCTTEDNCNNPCELSEAIYEPIDQTQHTCDCIAASNGAGSDSKSLMNSKDTCAVKQVCMQYNTEYFNCYFNDFSVAINEH